MTSRDIDQLNALPIETVAERLGLEVSRHKALCPFHADSHPSLTFHAARNRYHCFACGAHGSPIDLSMHLKQLPFIEACRWLAHEMSVPLTDDDTPRRHRSNVSTTVGQRRQEADEAARRRGEERRSEEERWKEEKERREEEERRMARYARMFEHPVLSPEARHFLFDQRRLDPRVVSYCRLSSWQDRQGIHWLQIPYYDQQGRLVGIQNRNLDYRKPSEMVRFRFPRGSRCGIYNLPVLRLLRPGEPLYIAEGCSDCWSLLSSGHKSIAVPSATILRTDDLRPLAGRCCHIYPDRDQAGEQLYRRLLQTANEIGFCLVRHDLPAHCKDYSDYYLNGK